MGEPQALNGGARRNEIRKLLQGLETDLEERKFTISGENVQWWTQQDESLINASTAKLQFLVRLKSQIISAEVAAFFTENDIGTLCHYAFYQNDFSTGQSETIIQSSQVALKCLANVLLLEKTTRQIFVDGRYAEAAAIILNRSQEDELLCSRILFLLTYDTHFEFDELFEDCSLAESIHKNIAFHAVKYVRYKEETEQAGKGDSLPILHPAALTESLKLLFNLTQFYPRYSGAFVDTIDAILEILTSIQLQPQALQPPVTQLINALLSLDLPGIPDSEDYTPLFPKDDPNQSHLRLITILNSTVRTLKEEDLETVVPLITLLRRVYELAPLPIKTDIQTHLLPSNSERAQPLGKTDSLPSHLLRLSTSPIAPTLREGISSLLFELSNKDATTFVRNVGYGFAAGFLMTHSLPVPEGTLSNKGGGVDPGEKMTKVDGREINPITGQRRDMEPEDVLPEMTDEEKEREAEKLFVLFERLKATGVMNVVNPVEQAAREGRFEEID